MAMLLVLLIQAIPAGLFDYKEVVKTRAGEICCCQTNGVAEVCEEPISQHYATLWVGTCVGIREAGNCQ